MNPTGDLPGAANSDRIRVLCVDRDPQFVSATGRSLERETDRLEAVTATTAAEGLEHLERLEIDCVVAADELTDTDGLALLEAVRDRDATLPFVLFAGSGSEALASEAISAGVTDYIRKDSATDQSPILANRIVTAVETNRTQRQRNRQHRAIETAQEGIGLLEPSGEFIYVNQSYADCYGYERSELIGEEWTILYDDAEAEFLREHVLPTIHDSGDWRGETNGYRADGTPITVDHTLAATEHGELICTVRDITDRKERERTLERYETIVEALGDPVYTVDSEGRYAFVNDAYAAMTGYEKSELVGEPISFLFDQPSVERGEEAVRTLLSDATDTTQQTYEITITAKDGSRIECEDHVSLLPLEDGQYRGVSGVVRDISGRKARERELEQYETILQTIPDEVYTLDADGYFTKVVPPIDSDVATSGYSPDELVGEHVSTVLSDEAIATGESKIKELLRNEDRETASFELELQTKSGTRVPNENHIALLPSDESSSPRGTVGVLRNIAKRKEREETLRRQNDRLESFASLVSHDLRNPLNVAQGQLELEREANDTARLELVAQALERMQRLIEDMLTVAREDDAITETEPIDLETFATVCWQHVETDDATLVCESTAVVQADRSRFKQLLENLIRNAVEHGTPSPQRDAVERGSTDGSAVATADETDRDTARSPPGDADGTLEEAPRARSEEDGVDHGSKRDQPPDDQSRDSDSRESVTVTVGALSGEAGFFVEDDGIGIPPDERESVFENGYTTTADGTGFGLSIVERIATAHGWRVELTASDADGARFEFRTGEQ